jgi:hypothetical protein
MAGCGRSLPRGMIGYCDRCGPDRRPAPQPPAPGRVIRRIGRQPTAAEDRLRAAIEDPHALDGEARALVARDKGLEGEGAVRHYWLSLGPTAREQYRTIALARLRQLATRERERAGV